MQTERLIELEQRLALVESELQAARAQNRELRRQSRKVAYTTRSLCLIVLIGFALLVIGGAPHVGAKASTPGQRPITVLDAPFLILGKSKNAIAEISEDKGKYGIRVYGPTGGSINLGFSAPNGEGNIRLLAPGEKIIAQISQQGFLALDPATEQVVASMDRNGFYVNNSSGKAVGSLGVMPSGSGFMALGNPNGDRLVEAGMLDGRGIVRALPLGGPPPMVIPQFIKGAKPK